MPRKAKEVTDAELAVLGVLWERETATIREITEVLYPRGSTSHYATVQKLLERLEAKGCVKRNRTRVPHEFRAAVDREELIGRELRALAEKLGEGSLTPVLTHLVRMRSLSSEERRSLRHLLDELEQGSPTTRKGQ